MYDKNKIVCGPPCCSCKEHALSGEYYIVFDATKDGEPSTLICKECIELPENTILKQYLIQHNRIKDV